MEEKSYRAATILRGKEVSKRIGLSRSTLYMRLAEGTFPKPISLGARAVGWLESEVEAWIGQQVADSRRA